jgi:hypothetical protein
VTPEPSLSELAVRYGTDKGPPGQETNHDYTPIYEGLLGARREEVQKVIELGVKFGASLRMWADYFPSARVWGVDVEDRTGGQFDGSPQVHLLIGEATSAAVARRLTEETSGEVDLIVDDASHEPEQVRAAYRRLFPLLRRGGVYVVEDVQPVGTGHAMWICRADGDYSFAGAAWTRPPFHTRVVLRLLRLYHRATKTEEWT